MHRSRQARRQSTSARPYQSACSASCPPSIVPYSCTPQPLPPPSLPHRYRGSTRGAGPALPLSAKLTPTPWLALVRGLPASPPATSMTPRLAPAIARPLLSPARCSRAAASFTARAVASAAASTSSSRRAASATALPAAAVTLSAAARLLAGVRVAALPIATQNAPRSFSSLHSGGNSPATGSGSHLTSPQ